MTKIFLPEFDRMMETEQNHPHHMYSVGEHTLHTLGAVPAEKDLRLAMLLHDIGKPKTLSVDEEGITHFHGHPVLGADIAKKIMRRLRFDNDTTDTVTRLARYHDYGNGVNPDMRLVRRAIHKVGEDIFPKLLLVRYADVQGQSDYLEEEKQELLKNWNSMYEEVQQQEQCVSLKTMAVTGSDLIAAGMKPGKEIGAMLGELLEMVLENPECNHKEFLLEEAQHRMHL